MFWSFILKNLVVPKLVFDLDIFKRSLNNFLPISSRRILVDAHCDPLAIQNASFSIDQDGRHPADHPAIHRSFWRLNADEESREQGPTHWTNKKKVKARKNKTMRFSITSGTTRPRENERRKRGGIGRKSKVVLWSLQLQPSGAVTLDPVTYAATSFLNRIKFSMLFHGFWVHSESLWWSQVIHHSIGFSFSHIYTH